MRVPARFAMLAALFLAVLAGLGAAWLGGRGRRGRALVVAAGVLVLVETAHKPLAMQAPVTLILGPLEKFKNRVDPELQNDVGMMERNAQRTSPPHQPVARPLQT